MIGRKVPAASGSTRASSVPIWRQPGFPTSSSAEPAPWRSAWRSRITISFPSNSRVASYLSGAASDRHRTRTASARRNWIWLCETGSSRRQASATPWWKFSLRARCIFRSIEDIQTHSISPRPLKSLRDSASRRACHLLRGARCWRQDQPQAPSQHWQRDQRQEDVGTVTIAFGNEFDDTELVGEDHRYAHQYERRAGSPARWHPELLLLRHIGDPLVESMDERRSSLDQRPENHRLEDESKDRRLELSQHVNDRYRLRIDFRIMRNHQKEEQKSRYHPHRSRDQSRHHGIPLPHEVPGAVQNRRDDGHAVSRVKQSARCGTLRDVTGMPASRDVGTEGGGGDDKKQCKRAI